MAEMTLKELCQYCHVSRRAVQGYEKAGLVQATGKTNRGYLLYDTAAQKKVMAIRKFQSFGFSLKEIADYELCTGAEKSVILERKFRLLVQAYQNLGRRIEEMKREMEILNPKGCENLPVLLWNIKTISFKKCLKCQ